ncbi:MAG: hypothetical protein HY747_12320 [Elusimicrobia bacterium]|nr:hypothetical protein [Elusimicrobiota bacterium]
MPKNRPYHVRHYAITMRLDADSGRFENTVAVRLVCLGPATMIELDSVGLKINKVRGRCSVSQFSRKIEKLSNVPIELAFRVDEASGLLTIVLPDAQPAARELILEIAYSGQAGLGHEGFFRVNDPDDAGRLPLYFTHFEAISARKFFPCNDEPYDKAVTEIIIEVDPRYSVLSNGLKVSDRLVTLDGCRRRRVHWAMSKPHSAYLVNAAIGEFGVLRGSSEGIRLCIFTAQGRQPRARFALEAMKHSMKFFKKFYGIPYPWERYGMVGIPGFLWGGMENTTLSSMRESAMTLDDPSSELAKLRIACVVSHELSHQWFGNYVTMKWWDDLWLNEAFASYMETLAMQDFFKSDFSLVETIMALWENYFRQEDGPRSHPIVSKVLPTPNDAFDSTNYIKGEQVLRMLEFYIGSNAFKKGVSDYLNRHAFGNATHEDFIRAMETVSGTNLSNFTKSWLLSRGYPVIMVKESWNQKNKKMVIEIVQQPNHKKENTIFDFKLPVVFHRLEGPEFHLEKTIHVKTKKLRVELRLPDCPDWSTWNPKFAALVKIKRAGARQKRWARQALNDPEPISRIAALFELLGSWVDRQVKVLKPLAPLAKKTLIQSLESDPSPYVRSACLEKLIDAKWNRYPNDLAPAILATAMGSGLHLSEDLTPWPDVIGAILVRSRAMMLLGKMAYPAGRRYLVDLLKDKRLGLDLFSAAISGIAAFSNPAAVKTIAEALSRHGVRGYPFRRAALLAYGMVRRVSVLAQLKRVITDCGANNEIAVGIFARLANNEVIKNSKEGAQFIKDFVLGDAPFNDEVKAGALEVLEESKNQAVRPALKAIAGQSPSERLRALAKKILEKNF